MLRHALRWVPRRPRACVAISNGVAEDARRALPWARVHAVLNCVDLDLFSPGPADPAWLDGLAGVPAPEGAVRIGLVATYAKWKGHEVYLRAAASLIHEGGPELFYLVGGPLYRTEGSQFTQEQLRDLADRLGAAGKVRFVPFQQDVRRVYRALDIVVHASTEPEPFGRTIAEAMACGRAVIASPRGGSRELFRDGLDALAAEPGDAARLASRIRELARDRGRRELLARAARQTACDRFSRARLGRQIAELYGTLVAERAGEVTRPA
jgi:glycosyltransferase involved in cell wall biosynthesis